jgi:hypothetical protein
VTEPRELRIGDAERTQAAQELGEHYAQGRLTTEEHHERLDRIWEARTRTELAPIFRDLPGSTYAAPASYPSARMPGVGSEAAGTSSTPTWAGNRPVDWGQRRPIARRRGGFPIILRILLAILLIGVVLAHLPLILLGVLVWFVLVHKGGGRPRRHAGMQHRRW